MLDPLTLPPDLQEAVELLTRVATKQEFAFAGMMLRIDPPMVTAIGNVKERGHEFAALLRGFADIMDEAATKNSIVENKISKPS
jgi:hypothetical protein